MITDTIKVSLEAIDAPQMLHVYEKADIEMQRDRRSWTVVAILYMFQNSQQYMQV